MENVTVHPVLTPKTPAKGDVTIGLICGGFGLLTALTVIGGYIYYRRKHASGSYDQENIVQRINDRNIIELLEIIENDSDGAGGDDVIYERATFL